MRSTKSFIILVLLAIYIQIIECQNADGETKPANDLLAKSYPLEARERGMRDVWDQIKSSALSAWEFLKRIAENTRVNITKWEDSVREYAIKVEKTFDKQIKALQTRLSNIITDLLGTGKIVQECLKNERRNVQEALKEILKKMTECVSNEIKQLTQISGKQAKLSVNDTLFIADLDEKHDACEADKPNYEECLLTVRELVYDQIKEMDYHIQKTSLESRSITDDIKNTLATCSLQNLADASSYLTSQMMDVAKCVLDSNINEAIIE